ncbi:hypothetical protein C8J56DRAFT_902733 [Mycena floridula]|nr:hypothetical protein C8J56DRAFT_902733 [Mycena floridula]
MYDAAGFADEFKNLLKAAGVKFEPFYVHKAFLECFAADEVYDGSLMQFRYFIATPLLPCGPADAGVKKYTGNDDVGAPPTDHLTAVLHAFMHYTSEPNSNNRVYWDGGPQKMQSSTTGIKSKGTRYLSNAPKPEIIVTIMPDSIFLFASLKYWLQELN